MTHVIRQCEEGTAFFLQHLSIHTPIHSYSSTVYGPNVVPLWFWLGINFSLRCQNDFIPIGASFVGDVAHQDDIRTYCIIIADQEGKTTRLAFRRRRKFNS